MALIHCNFYSRNLAYDTQVNVILPENRAPYMFDDSKPYKFQVLYLLHGRGDDCNGWVRGTAIERYASQHQIAVVMPSGEDSFYTDSVNGKRYFSYMTEELPGKMRQWFPVSDKPEDTFVAGLSMGGYGALKMGLTYPERYAGIGLFSACVSPHKLYGLLDNDLDNEIMAENIDRVFGKNGFRDEDMMELLMKSDIEQGKTIPPIIQYEGTQDLLYEMNQEFYQFAVKHDQDITYEEWDGVHDWIFWDACIEKALKAFSLKNRVIREN